LKNKKVDVFWDTVYKYLDRISFRFVTIHAFDRLTDRQADGQTEFSSLDRVCIPYSAVKTVPDRNT